MIRRLFLFALVALFAAFTLGGDGPARSAAQAPAGARTYLVHNRVKGQPAFHLFGHYATEGSARAVAEHLRAHGFEANIRAVNVALPRLAPRQPSRALPAHQTVTLARARELFHLMARQHDVAFRYPIDGCYARAELMIERMRRHGAHPHRVWSVAHGEPLHARTKNVKAGYVEWGYHVAPILRVRVSATTQKWYVIDPSLFHQPVTIPQWEAAQMRTPQSHRPYVTLTRLGEAPVWVDHKRKPGHGYWPGSDPREGLHNHAVATMKRYKALEGRVRLDRFAPGQDDALAWELPGAGELLLLRLASPG